METNLSVCIYCVLKPGVDTEKLVSEGSFFKQCFIHFFLFPNAVFHILFPVVPLWSKVSYRKALGSSHGGCWHAWPVECPGWNLALSTSCHRKYALVAGCRVWLVFVQRSQPCLHARWWVATLHSGFCLIISPPLFRKSIWMLVFPTLLNKVPFLFFLHPTPNFHKHEER